MPLHSAGAFFSTSTAYMTGERSYSAHSSKQMQRGRRFGRELVMFYSAFARGCGLSDGAILYLPSNPCEKFAKPVMLLASVEKNAQAVVPVEKNVRGGKKSGRWVRADGALREVPIEHGCAC